jgi:hypothetical protein
MEKGVKKEARKILSDLKYSLRNSAVLKCRPFDGEGLPMTRSVACKTNLEREEYMSVVSDDIAC